MSCKEIWLEIVIPLVSSLISGILTVIGVGLTIKHENKKDKRILKLSNKPIFYRIDPMQEYDYKSAVDYQFNFNCSNRIKEIYGIFKNTDNALLLLNYISVNGKKYFPNFGDVIDKNVIFNICVNCEENINSETEVIMCIRDVLNNEYRYNLICEISDKEIINIKEFEEINKKVK